MDQWGQLEAVDTVGGGSAGITEPSSIRKGANHDQGNEPDPMEPPQFPTIIPKPPTYQAALQAHFENHFGRALSYTQCETQNLKGSTDDGGAAKPNEQTNTAY